MFDTISQYALERLPAFAGKRHQRNRRWGMSKVTCASPDNLGLIDYPVWNRHSSQALSALEDNGRSPMVKNVGGCAGKPHAWFDGEGLETEPRPPRQPLTLPRLKGM